MHLISPKKWLPALLVCAAISTSPSYGAQYDEQASHDYVAKLNQQECRQLIGFVETLSRRILEDSLGRGRYGEAQIKLYEMLIGASSPHTAVILDAIEKLESARGESSLSKEFIKTHHAGLTLVTAKCADK